MESSRDQERGFGDVVEVVVMVEVIMVEVAVIMVMVEILMCWRRW